MAFDAAGNLYVADRGKNAIHRFSPTGADLGVFASTGLSDPAGLAFDANYNLYVANYGGSTVRRFSSTGTDLGNFATGLRSPAGLAFRPSTQVNTTFNLSGTVTLQDAVNKAQMLAFQFRPTDGSASFTQMVTLHSDGTFSLAGIPAVAYTLAIKGSKWLQKVISVDGTNGDVSGLATTLLAGDIDGDNQVSLADYALLRNAFGSKPDDAHWNANADLNCDGEVSLADYVLLRNNFGKKGDP